MLNNADHRYRERKKFAEQLRQKLLAWTFDDGDNRDRDEVFMSSMHPIEVPSDVGDIVAAVRGNAVPGHDLLSHYFNYTKTEAAALIIAHLRIADDANEVERVGGE